MKQLGRSLILGGVLLAGCGTTRNVAVSSYHVTRDVAAGSYRVATAPVHYSFRRHGGEADTAIAAEIVPADVNQPGQTLPPPEGASSPRQPRRASRESPHSAPT